MPIKCNLKEIRNKRNLQQKELGAALKSDGRTISRYETGERCPSLEMALRLASYLKLQVDEIFELEDAE